jgi:hypothetical protein
LVWSTMFLNICKYAYQFTTIAILVNCFPVLGFSFLFVSPFTVSLISKYFEVRNDKVLKSSQNDSKNSVLRMIVPCLFTIIIAPLGIFFLTTSNVTKYPGRISRSFTPEQVDEVNAAWARAKNEQFDGKYHSSHITISLFLYSTVGSFLSVPFFLRKDFLAILVGRKNSQQAISLKSNTPQNSNYEKSIKNGELND